MEAIYAIDMNNGLSRNGVIPWKSKKDMTFFMNKTKNNIVIMGKNTYFSIPEQHRPLKNRLNIVLSRTLDLEMNLEMDYSNVLFTNNDHIYEDILKQKNKYCETYNYLNKDFKIFCIGGKSIYEQFIPLCDIVWVTNIKCDYQCDLFMDYDYDLKDFNKELCEEDDELNIIKYTRK